MRHHAGILAGLALLTLSAGPALASCADEIAALSAKVAGSGGAGAAAHGGGISKDGSLAPLQDSSTAASTEANSSTGGKVAKDGSNMPLSGTGEGPSPTTAMSDQDAQSQQQGGQTAAEASQASGNGEMTAALDQARAAEKAGDETGCMKALEKFR
jgi:hypothetical protein